MTYLRVTTDDELDQHFEGIMIPCYDFDAGNYRVPGWECKHCGWRVGTVNYPPSHECPADGQKQQPLAMLNEWAQEGE